MSDDYVVRKGYDWQHCTHRVPEGKIPWLDYLFLDGTTKQKICEFFENINFNL